MSTVQTRQMTAEEFWEWASRPENQDTLYELENGEPIAMPPPAEFHGVVCSLIAFVLWKYIARRGKGYVCSNDTGLLIRRNPDTVRGPDLMLIEEPLRFDQLSRKFTERVPRLVVEVLSPHDQHTKTTRRVGQYLKRGIPLIWVVDPELRSVTICRADGFPQVVDETEELTGEEILPDFRCRVTEFFTGPEQAEAQG
jgi:Uma2 family endonuclease